MTKLDFTADDLSMVFAGYGQHPYRKHLRFGQYLCNELGIQDTALFYMDGHRQASDYFWANYEPKES